MSLTQTYMMSEVARFKLRVEAQKPDFSLRHLVGHANLLNEINAAIDEAEQEQENWFNQILRSVSPQLTPAPGDADMYPAGTTGVNHNNNNNNDLSTYADAWPSQAQAHQAVANMSMLALPGVVSSIDLDGSDDEDDEDGDDVDEDSEVSLEPTSPTDSLFSAVSEEGDFGSDAQVGLMFAPPRGLARPLQSQPQPVAGFVPMTTTTPPDVVMSPIEEEALDQMADPMNGDPHHALVRVSSNSSPPELVRDDDDDDEDTDDEDALLPRDVPSGGSSSSAAVAPLIASEPASASEQPARRKSKNPRRSSRIRSRSSRHTVDF